MYLKRIIIFGLTFFILVNGSILHDVSGQQLEIPNWFRNTAGWWGDSIITDQEFVSSVEYLINLGLIDLQVTKPATNTNFENIPAWIKNNAKWWSDNQIANSDFVSGIESMINEGMIGTTAQKPTNLSNSFSIEKLPTEDGLKVTWKIKDSKKHAITSGNIFDGSDGNFDSTIFDHQTTLLFNEEGTFEYFDLIQPWASDIITISSSDLDVYRKALEQKRIAEELAASEQKRMLEELKVIQQQRIEEEHKKMAAELAASEQKKTAEELEFKNLSAISKQELETLIHKGKAFTFFKRWDDAFYYFDKALKIAPSSSEAQQGKDNAYNQIKEIESQIEKQNEILKNNPSDIKALSGKGYLLGTLQRFDEAIVYCDKALEIEPFEPQAMGCKYYISNAMGRYEDAIKYSDMLSFAGMGRENPEIILALYQLGKYDEIITVMENLEAKFGESSGEFTFQKYLLQGIIAEKQNKPEVEYYYKLANSIHPIINEQQIESLKASMYFGLKDYEKAIYYLEKLPEDTENVSYMKVIAYDELEKKSPITGINKVVSESGEKIEETVKEIQNSSPEGGCLIATATYGSELSPQVQQLRELRDNTLLQTNSGSTFLTGFNQFYYSFSPTIADWERQNPVFKESVKLAITPLLTSLSILNFVDLNSEESVLGYGIAIILLNVGMYFVAPAIVIVRIKQKF